MSSATLEQQELLEVPPARRIIVPHGHSAWWGVDTSVARVAIGWVDPAGVRGAWTVSLDSLTGGQRLASAHESLRRAVAGAVRAGNAPLPGLVLVEQPSGARPNPALSYMVGVVQAAAYAGLMDAGAGAVRMETCVSSWWKKLGCGYGGIRKPKKGDAREYQVLTWARLNGYTGSSWDEADALAIAEAGRRFCVLEER